MGRVLHSIFSSSSFSIVLALVCTFFPRLIHSKTLDSDIQVLRALKHSVDPNSINPSSFLRSWNFATDPCENFLGILCTNPRDNSSTRITTLDISGNSYDGFISPAIGNLSELIVLNLSKNKFRGPIPETISNLEQLTELLISENFFTGDLPSGIHRLKKLEILDASQNNLAGPIPTAITGLRCLNSMSLANNGFSGRIPNLHGLWQLRTLDLSSNQLYGHLPNLPMRLNTLSLGHNLLSGRLTPLKRLRNLEILDLSDNRFDGSIVVGILTLPALTHINVSANRFTAIEMIKFSGRPTQLQVLDAHQNIIYGHLPINLVTVENLREINLGHNQFSGPIPLAYGEKLEDSWRSLFLDYNFLVGKLPKQFRNSEYRNRGSLAHNCLRCPLNITWCIGGQKPAPVCVRQNSGSG